MTEVGSNLELVLALVHDLFITSQERMTQRLKSEVKRAGSSFPTEQNLLESKRNLTYSCPLEKGLCVAQR